MSDCCPCLANGCGPGGTLNAHTIILGHGKPYLQGTSPPPGRFASTDSQHLGSARDSLPDCSLGWHDRLAAARDFAFLNCFFVWVCACGCCYANTCDVYHPCVILHLVIFHEVIQYWQWLFCKQIKCWTLQHINTSTASQLIIHLLLSWS